MIEHPGPPPSPPRHRLPDDRRSVTKKITIYGNENQTPKEFDLYVTVGLYPDGQVGEVFIRFGNIGGRERSLLDAWCVMVSMALQYGINLQTVIDKFRNWRFEPSGLTNLEEIRFVTSPLDGIVRWIEQRFIGGMAPGVWSAVASCENFTGRSDDDQMEIPRHEAIIDKGTGQEDKP